MVWPQIGKDLALGRVIALLAAVTTTGCGLAPKSRLDDCAKVAQSLRAENGQLKDATLSLRGENADLTQRAVNDARRIAALEESNGRLESSVQAYIDEREDLNDAFQRIKRLAQASVAPPSSAMISKLKAFASQHPGTTFDASRGLLSVEADRLFVPGTDRLRPEAKTWLEACGVILADPEAKAWPLLVAGHATDSLVRQTSTGDPVRSPGDLSLARAVRVRDALADRADRDPNAIGVAGLGTSRPIVEGSNDRARSANARIEIELTPGSERVQH